MKTKFLAVSALVLALVARAEVKPIEVQVKPAKPASEATDEHAGHDHAKKGDTAATASTNGIRLADGSIVPPAKPNTNNITLTNIYQAAAYIMGVQDAASIYMQGSAEYIDPEIYIRGFRDVFGHYKPLIPIEQTEDIMKDFEKEMQRKDAQKNLKVAEENKKRGKEFLEENKKKEGVVTTPTGLQYKVLKEGKGTPPTLDDRVAVHFRGMTIDGVQFSTSYKHTEPSVVPLRYQIDGWKEALMMMKPGSKWEVYIPSELAYKEREVGRGVGGNSTLVFELELVRVEKEPAAEAKK